MAQSKKELVLSAMDRREVERVPSGFWFHFLADEIHADAYADPRLEQTLLDGELRYIDGFQPDFVKIMTDGFFSYPNPVVQTARTAAELAKVEPLPDDHPFFTRQIAYAGEITRRYGNEIATFYNIFSAATTVKFMQPGAIDESETFLTNLVREDKAAVKAASAPSASGSGRPSSHSASARASCSGEATPAAFSLSPAWRTSRRSA